MIKENSVRDKHPIRFAIVHGHPVGDDLADACLFLMNLDPQVFASLVTSESVPPLINIGSSRDQAIREIAELIADIVGFDGQLTFDTTKPDGTPRKLLDTSRLTSLGWAPKTTLREGLTMAYRDFLQHSGVPVSQAAEHPGV